MCAAIRIRAEEIGDETGKTDWIRSISRVEKYNAYLEDASQALKVCRVGLRRIERQRNPPKDATSGLRSNLVRDKAILRSKSIRRNWLIG